jgi:WhiB family redox-sensing transcriptional regulator
MTAAVTAGTTDHPAGLRSAGNGPQALRPGPGIGGDQTMPDTVTRPRQPCITPGCNGAAQTQNRCEPCLRRFALLPSSQSWAERGLCAQVDPETFFPEKGGSTRKAKKVCRACDVRAECLGYALEHDERFGIWGGLSERERRRLKREGQAA